MKPQILLTFDLEEFDLPLEFGSAVTGKSQIEISNEGLFRLTDILSRHKIPATFFTTSFYAGENPGIMKDLSVYHEIASHSRSHSGFKESDIAGSKADLELITGRPVLGFRMPRFRKTDMTILREAGYSYDSSVNPTFIPGRYNNLSSPRRYYPDAGSGLAVIPVSVSPFLRIPLFWLSFKNMPYSLYLSICRKVLKKDKYLHLYFHPWEFADIGSFDIPLYIKRISGHRMSERFERLISDLGGEGEFSEVSVFLKSRGMIG